jgi:hypothetical protein
MPRKRSIPPALERLLGSAAGRAEPRAAEGAGLRAGGAAVASEGPPARAPKEAGQASLAGERVWASEPQAKEAAELGARRAPWTLENEERALTEEQARMVASERTRGGGIRKKSVSFAPEAAAGPETEAAEPQQPSATTGPRQLPQPPSAPPPPPALRASALTGPRQLPQQQQQQLRTSPLVYSPHGRSAQVWQVGEASPAHTAPNTHFAGPVEPPRGAPPPLPPPLPPPPRQRPLFLVAMASAGEARDAALATMVGWAEVLPPTPHRWLVFVPDAESLLLARVALPAHAEPRLLPDCASPMCHGSLTALREARLEAAHAALPLLWVGAGVIPVRDPLPHLLRRHLHAPQPGRRARRPVLALAGSRTDVLLAPVNQLAALDRAVVRAHDLFLRGAAPSADLALLRALRQVGVAMLEPEHFPELGSLAEEGWASEAPKAKGAPAAEGEGGSVGLRGPFGAGPRRPESEGGRREEEEEAEEARVLLALPGHDGEVWAASFACCGSCRGGAGAEGGCGSCRGPVRAEARSAGGGAGAEGGSEARTPAEARAAFARGVT